MNIEAYPDPAPPIIEIIAQYPGQSPEEVERYVTIPIEIAVASTPGLKYIRSNSVFALGFIRLQFEYGRDYYFVRQQALNRLKDVELPAGVQPVISPAGTISEIFRYQLVGPPNMDLIELRTFRTGSWSAGCASSRASPTCRCSAARPRNSRPRSISTGCARTA